jgi:hypothetical protein
MTSSATPVSAVEDLSVGQRVRRYDVTLTKTADNVWQGNAPCATDAWIDGWLAEGASLLPPLDVDELRARLAEIADHPTWDDPAWSPPLRIAAKYAAYGRPDDWVWPASLSDDDVRAALIRHMSGCRPGPLEAVFPDTPEKLRGALERYRLAKGEPE